MKRNIFILILCVIISLLILLYPPWNYAVVTKGNKIIREAGYDFFWKPPSIPVTYEKVFSEQSVTKFYNSIPVFLWSSEINIERLVIQLLIVNLLFFLFGLLLSKYKKDYSND